MALSIAFACPTPDCGAFVEGPLEPTTTSMTCASCRAVTPLPEAAAVAAEGAARSCPVCGGADLYQQRDFNRTLGLSLAAVGLLSGPFTKWIGTVAMIGLDAILYATVPSVAICYACEAQQRGYDKARGPRTFDIAIHDVYKFGRRFPPRRERAVAGPLARHLDWERRRR